MLQFLLQSNLQNQSKNILDLLLNRQVLNQLLHQ
nr:hypothetical protein Q903MT_gene5278 [Picea sitchensis]